MASILGKHWLEYFEYQGCIVEFESGPAKIRQLSVGDTRASGPGVSTARAGVGGAQRPPPGEEIFS